LGNNFREAVAKRFYFERLKYFRELIYIDKFRYTPKGKRMQLKKDPDQKKEKIRMDTRNGR